MAASIPCVAHDGNNDGDYDDRNYDNHNTVITVLVIVMVIVPPTAACGLLYLVAVHSLL